MLPISTPKKRQGRMRLVRHLNTTRAVIRLLKVEREAFWSVVQQYPEISEARLENIAVSVGKY